MVGASVVKCLCHRTIGAGLSALLVCLIAVGADGVIEIFPETAVGGRHFHISILDRDVAGGFIEQLLISLPGGMQFILEPVYFGHICGDLHDKLHVTAGIANGGGMNDHRRHRSVF